MTGDRRPVHTMYGGAHLFSAEISARAGAAALDTLRLYAPDAVSFARLTGISGPRKHLELLYGRVVEKLRREPVEDYRIDFEDGFGVRSDEEEDAEAERTGAEAARACALGTLPSRIGIRPRPFSGNTADRAARTVELFFRSFTRNTGKIAPGRWVVTLPKISGPAEVETAASLLTLLEHRNGLPAGSLRIELMVETPAAFFRHDGVPALPSLIAAAGGRCSGIHIGPYDLTASLGISAPFQDLGHPVCDLSRSMMLFAAAGTEIVPADGPTAVLPIGPHRIRPGSAASKKQLSENRKAVAAAWKLSVRNIRHALSMGLYQGWDLHPAQLPVRYGVLYDYFLNGREAAGERLGNFLMHAGRAVRSGDLFDDAATVRGLIGFFERGYSCGAFTADDLARAGITSRESDILSGLDRNPPVDARR
ncbi:MAG TPA: phosphoenolpyruvate kinase [Bacteroidota bacterium]|nr:phosphoenolpyruvate kinase [Bacteroidota bacterium]